ncbi:MAG: type III pantothenate kinase [Gammaproteobacteria bacterium]
MNLLVDIGNSNIKWSFSNGAELDHVQTFLYTQDTLVSLLTSNLKSDKRLPAIEKIIVCCVASEDIKSIFTTWIEKNTLKIPDYIESSYDAYGVKNAYKNVTNLGNDRWLLLLYVHHFYKTDVCVIDCGTAVTIDVVLESGQHQGGLIAPGYMSQISALQLKTNIINNHQYVNQKKIPLLQNDTDLCIEQGCRQMLLGFIKTVVSQLKQQYGDTLQVVLTGGDSNSLASDLPSEWHYEPELLFYGLLFYSKQKVNQN